jgi:membrane-bound serine protease (ClpP class)
MDIKSLISYVLTRYVFPFRSLLIHPLVSQPSISQPSVSQPSVSQPRKSSLNEVWVHFKKAIHYTALLCLTLAMACITSVSHAQSTQNSVPIVYVAKIDGTIDLGLAPYVERVLKEAQAAQAQAVILQINTFGGRVDAAVIIRDALLKSPLTTIAFIDSRAISAGALISLAATKIAMTPGATIGAATPVQMGPGGQGAQPVSEKTVSYVRKEFASTAQARGKPTQIAEAMVDADVEIKGLSEKGKLLTLTTQEALQVGVANYEAASITALLGLLNISDAQIKEPSVNWAEEFVRFLTNPVVSSLLITLAMLGIILEIRTPGFGIPGAIGITCLGLFLYGHSIVDLVGLEEVLLVLTGIVLLTLELFVIPGFGIVGLLGIVTLGAALVMSIVGAGATLETTLFAVGQIGFSLALAIALSFIFFKFLPKMPFGRAFVLDTKLDGRAGFLTEPLRDHVLLNRHGVAHSTLRPAGIAEIDGQRIDVVSEGEFIEAGTPIKVLRVDGNRIVVDIIH